MTSPTQRSLARLRKDGWLAAIVEKWNPHVQIRQDLWGFADLVAVRGDDTLLVQTTSDSGGNVSAHIDKVVHNPHAALWLSSQTRRIVVHGWAKKGPRGQVKRWTCREIEITAEMIKG